MKTLSIALLFVLSTTSFVAYAGDSSGDSSSWRDSWRAFWSQWREDNSEEWATVRSECREGADSRREYRRCRNGYVREVFRDYRNEMSPREVPEIDGTSLPLALGLLAGIFGLVRERQANAKKKAHRA